MMPPLPPWALALTQVAAPLWHAQLPPSAQFPAALPPLEKLACTSTSPVTLTSACVPSTAEVPAVEVTSEVALGAAADSAPAEATKVSVVATLCDVAWTLRLPAPVSEGASVWAKPANVGAAREAEVSITLTEIPPTLTPFASASLTLPELALKETLPAGTLQVLLPVQVPELYTPPQATVLASLVMFDCACEPSPAAIPMETTNDVALALLALVAVALTPPCDPVTLPPIDAVVAPSTVADGNAMPTATMPPGPPADSPSAGLAGGGGEGMGVVAV